MSDALDVDGLERKAYLVYNEDGLLDIITGFLMVFIGYYVLSKVDIPFAPFLAIFGPAVWASLKKAVTEPRIGRVKFGPGRRSRQQKVIMAFAVAVNVLLVLSFFVKTGPFLGPWRTTLYTYGVILVGSGIVSLILFTIGHFNEVSRFKGYAAVSVPMFVAGHFLTDPGLDLFQRLAHVMIPLGLLMLAYGGVTLWRFVRKYPKITDVGVDG
ncbi:hypothetical protein H8E65_08920 [Candidatus Bathyarchaeota archaeon]|nr:hypothetical protein [Candidatus Bathyarchaeota archaeon]MBL7079150.1 hypothetical protein [Candidatus Bathyarchaeota archaeon]